MIGTVITIGLNTIRQAVRNRVFYSIFFFGLLLIAATGLGENFTIGVADRVLRDFATGAIDLVGLLLAVFLGVGEITREVENRSIYGTLATPASRMGFLVGKYFGLLCVLILSLGPMFLEFLVLQKITGSSPVSMTTLGAYFWLRLLSLGMVVALTLLLSVSVSPFVAVSTTLGLYLVGTLSEELGRLAAKAESGAERGLGQLLYLVVPHFNFFDLSHQLAYSLPVQAKYVGVASAYAIVYSLALLLIASRIFGKKDLL